MAHALNTIDIVAVGEPNELLAGTITDYQARLSSLVQLRVANIPGKPPDRNIKNVLVTEEAQRVAATVEAIETERGERFPILLCDHYGDTLTSDEFATRFLALPYLCVIVGGIFGLHDVLADRDMRRVSFGRVTLSPSIARLVVTDQLYRALRLSQDLEYDLN